MLQLFPVLVALVYLPVALSTASHLNTTNLAKLLSKNASIVYDISSVPRWSEFDAPSPGTIVNVATEHDVLVTVSRYS